MKTRYGATKTRALRRQREKEQSVLRQLQAVEAVARLGEETPFDPLLVKLSYNGYKIHFSSPATGSRVVDWQDRIMRDLFDPYSIKNIPSPEMLSKIFKEFLPSLILDEIRDDNGNILWRAE